MCVYAYVYTPVRAYKINTKNISMNSVHIYMHMYVCKYVCHVCMCILYIYVCVCTYTYMYTDRETERESLTDASDVPDVPYLCILH